MMISRLVVILCSALGFCAVLGAEKTAPQLIHLGGGGDQQIIAFPESILKLLFPKGEAILEHEPIPTDWQPSSMPLFKKIELVKISDPQGRFTLGGVVYGKKIFVFDELFCGENPVVMSQLMQATATAPKNSDEALVLARFYLSLSYYRRQNVDQFVISRIDAASFPQEIVGELQQILHIPRAISTGAGYKVELFSRTPEGFRLRRWQMTINPSGLENVSDQTVFPSHEKVRELYARAEKNRESGGSEKIELLHCCADGSSREKDGASTDLGALAASNGPGVLRLHYLYQPEENAKAEARFQRYLEGSVAVVDSGPWLDTDGQVAGRRATLIQADSHKTLSAVQLFQREYTVLEFYSHCLRNVLAARASPPRGKVKDVTPDPQAFQRW